MLRDRNLKPVFVAMVAHFSSVQLVAPTYCHLPRHTAISHDILPKSRLQTFIYLHIPVAESLALLIRRPQHASFVKHNTVV